MIETKYIILCILVLILILLAHIIILYNIFKIDHKNTNYMRIYKKILYSDVYKYFKTGDLLFFSFNDVDIKIRTFIHNRFSHVGMIYKENDDLAGWIKRIFLRSIIHQLKSNRTEYYITTTARIDEKKPNSDLFHQSEPEDPNNLLVEDYIKALQKMPCSFRAVYNLRLIEQMDVKETCDLMEINEDSAKNTLERARHEFSKNVKLKMQGY